MKRRILNRIMMWNLAVVMVLGMLFVNTSTVWADDFYTQGYDEFRKGSVGTAVIHGWSDIRYIGETLILDSDLSAEQDLKYQWYRSTRHTHLNFTGAGYKPPYKVLHEFEGEVSAIQGATGETYTLTLEDAGYFVLCEIKGEDGVFVTDSIKFPVKKSLTDVKLERNGDTFRVVTVPEGIEIAGCYWMKKGVPYYSKDDGKERAIIASRSNSTEYTLSMTDTTWLDEYNAKGELEYSPEAYYIGVIVLADGNKRIEKYVRIK